MFYDRKKQMLLDEILLSHEAHDDNKMQVFYRHTLRSCMILFHLYYDTEFRKGCSVVTHVFQFLSNLLSNLVI